MGVEKIANKDRWDSFTYDQKINFLALRKAVLDGYSLTDPELATVFPSYRRVYTQMEKTLVDEVFSTIKPYCRPQEVLEYIWQVRDLTKWSCNETQNDALPHKPRQKSFLKSYFSMLL